MPFDRRDVLKLGAAGTAAAAAGPLASVGVNAQGKPVVNLQLGWLFSGNQLGEICAKAMGYYDAEGVELRIQPGGPSIDGVAIVASGKFEIGQVSSSPSLMLAASQDLPIKCFAVGCAEHPYAFFSLKKNPIREPKDLIGKKVGIQATGVILLRALLAKNNIPESQVTIVTSGADMTPLMTGQVDCFTGWQTNTSALRVLGDQRVDMRLWDTGVKLYALPYYATNQTIQTKADVLAKFVRATAKGWEYAYNNREKAVDFLVKEFPNLKKEDELEAAETQLKYSFGAATRANGWGTMDRAIWQEQIDLHDQLKQFTKRTPKVDEVMTLDILKMTEAGRPKIG
ncbi:ABC transporter substrate-binding protein [Terrarubrum flagellatum]|uniref:ABC transporter substrate-binding protein n=1 Tax=Terrirubrum flagellatum TaxID=2895980 RepID=UPI0031453A55